MKKTKDILITAVIIAALVFVPYLFGSVLYDDDVAVFLWFRGLLTIFGLAGFTSGVVGLALMIYTTVKNSVLKL